MNKKFLLSTLLLIIFIDSLGYFLAIPVFFHIINQPSLIFSGAPSSWQSFMLDIAVPISSVASMIANPMIGAWSDRWGRRSVLLGCLMISFLGFFIPMMGLIFGSFFLILLGRALTGVASTSQPIAQAAVSDICSGSERARYFSLIACAMGSAMVLGPLVGEFLSEISLRAPYIAASVLVSLSLVLVFFLVRETVQSGQAKSEVQDASDRLPRQRVALPRNDGLRGRLLFFNKRDARGFLGLLFLTQFAWSLFYLAVPLQLVREYHDTMHHANLFLAWLGFWMVFGFLGLYRYALKFLSLEKIVSSSLLISMFGLLLCLVLQSPVVLWLGMIPVAIFSGFLYPSLLALICNHVAQNERGAAMGAASAILALAWMLSGFLFLPALHGWVELPMVGSAVLYGFCFLLYLSLRLSQPPASQ